MLRPVLMTCAIKPTCTASDKITIKDTLDSDEAQGRPVAIVGRHARAAAGSMRSRPR